MGELQLHSHPIRHLDSTTMVSTESRMNWKLVSGSVAVATLLVCGMVALLATAPSLTDMPIHHTGETDEMLAAAPLFYHGSNGNGVRSPYMLCGIVSIPHLFPRRVVLNRWVRP